MIFVVIGAALAATALVISGLIMLFDVAELNRTSPGPWGIISHQATRRRPLSAQERRWQTAITRAGTEASLWDTLVTALDNLDATAGSPPVSDPKPDQLERRYLNARISNLESHVNEQPEAQT